jgi:hypothetical protein
VDCGDVMLCDCVLDKLALLEWCISVVIWLFFETMADGSSSMDYRDSRYTCRDLGNSALSSSVSQWLSGCFERPKYMIGARWIMEISTAHSVLEIIRSSPNGVSHW